jgi:hypothetical protein
LFNSIKTNLKNIPGWSTRRKLLVIESDDWGAIRTPSLAVYNKFLEIDDRISKSHYCRLDSLENSDDLEHLFETLDQFRDSKGRPLCITANTIVANPDFERIKSGAFESYYYELFPTTYERYGDKSILLSLWKNGIENGFLAPQFHGREHLNVSRWMKGLRSDDRLLHQMFAYSFFGIVSTQQKNKSNNYLAALDFDDFRETETHLSIIKEGLTHFEAIFGFRSESFIAPNYTWHSVHEAILAESDVQFIQGGGTQRFPVEKGYKIRRNKLGSKSSENQFYLVRNCTFEPASKPDFDWVGNCLKEVEAAFRWNKPAVITSHRVNFIGSINLNNRIGNLSMLKSLVSRIVKRWPDVEFISSAQLGRIIASSN